MAKKKNEKEELQPIIIKKIKKGGDGHHGGAWKVAYADFVTAMMAFFLLLWLLNVTTEDAQNAISAYFDPSHPKVSESVSGSGGVLGGLTMSTQGSMAQQNQPVTAPQATGARRDNSETGEGAQEIDVAKLEEELRKEEDSRFEEAKKELEKELRENPELKKLADQVKVDITLEGLRIQIIDKEGRPLFPMGSAEMYDYTKAILEKVSGSILSLPNEISVRGHTDSYQYAPGAKYTNWELSADRANSTRRVLQGANIPEERFANVMGKADTEHFIPDKPLDPQNRRLSIILLRETLQQAVDRGAFGDKVPADTKIENVNSGKGADSFRRTPGAVHFP